VGAPDCTTPPLAEEGEDESAPREEAQQEQYGEPMVETQDVQPVEKSPRRYFRIKCVRPEKKETIRGKAWWEMYNGPRSKFIEMTRPFHVATYLDASTIERLGNKGHLKQPMRTIQARWDEQWLTLGTVLGKAKKEEKTTSSEVSD
jgi:hypothetical protein